MPSEGPKPLRNELLTSHASFSSFSRRFTIEANSRGHQEDHRTPAAINIKHFGPPAAVQQLRDGLPGEHPLDAKIAPGEMVLREMVVVGVIVVVVDRAMIVEQG